jgi:hypothetical protein
VPTDHGLWERILGEDTSIAEEGNDPGPGRHAKLLGGWISCVASLLLALGAVSATLLGWGMNITAGALGVGFGVLGYFLGPRRLATAAVFLCAAAILCGLAASQGHIS